MVPLTGNLRYADWSNLHGSYNHAVHVIRLRVHLLQKKLQESELRARSSSLYLCPGYKTKICNGKYSETEAQSIVDPGTGMFLCRECCRAYANHPSPPPKKDYTLQLLDNEKELKTAMDNLRRVRVQLSSKLDMHSQQMRRGIFDLLQKTSSIRGGEPITSNLPSENISMGIGSKRIAGTGRTAAILLRKQKQQGIVSADGTHAGGGGPGGGRLLQERDDLAFLKNAMGQEVVFALEKGGGARANLLATKGRIRNKLVDAAAMKVGVDIGLVARVIKEERERLKRKREEEKQREEDGTAKKKKAGEEHFFLKDNLGLAATTGAIGQVTSKEDREKRRLGHLGGGDDSSDDEEEARAKDYYISDETDELRNLPEKDRREVFQAQYKLEKERQAKLMGIASLDDPGQITEVTDEDDIEWEDGDAHG